MRRNKRDNEFCANSLFFVAVKDDEGAKNPFISEAKECECELNEM